MNYRNFCNINFTRIFYTVVFLCSFAFGAHAIFGSFSGKAREIEVDLDLFTEVLALIKHNYVEEVEDDELLRKAINGMLNSLDPHSSFLDGEDFDDIQMKIEGEFGGIGVEIIPNNGFLKVISPYYDGPAFRAGIRENDYIIKVEGESIEGMKSNDSVSLIRGEPGTKVNLTVYRESSHETFNVEIKREIVEIDPLRARVIDDKILYIHLAHFSEGATERVKEVIEEAHEKASEVEGIILDLRWNPGGIIEEAYALANLFLKSGRVFSVSGRNNDEEVVYNASGKDFVDGLPIIVLINGGSASASEIVTAALRDNMRAVTVGTKSFGKGSVQIVIPFSKTYGIKMTTALYYTPNGVAIQESKGIIPDIEVPFKILEQEDKKDDNLKIDGLEEEEEKEKYVTQRHAVEILTSSEIVDAQLLRAVDLMKNAVILKAVLDY